MVANVESKDPSYEYGRYDRRRVRDRSIGGDSVALAMALLQCWVFKRPIASAERSEIGCEPHVDFDDRPVTENCRTIDADVPELCFGQSLHDTTGLAACDHRQHGIAQLVCEAVAFGGVSTVG